MKKRIFLAIKLPQDIINQLEDLIGDFKLLNPNTKVNWVESQNLHLTVQFLGDLDTKEIKKLENILDEEVSKIKPINFRLTKLDAFPDINNPRTIFYELKQSGGIEIYNWQKNLVNALVNKGFNVDLRRWKTHITLGRNKLGEKINFTENKLEDLTFILSSIEIMESNLTENGPIYNIIKSFEFNKND